MVWKCMPDMQFEVQEKNKGLICPGCQSNVCTTQREEDVCLTLTGTADNQRDASIYGTVRCESNKLQMDLPLPNFSHVHRRAGTEEFDGKKINRAKNNF